jgi:hypothetical protein
MPSLNAGDIEACLLRKLQAAELPGRDRKFEVFDDDGVLIARTALSRSWRGTTSLSPNMVNNIKNQLHLARSQDFVRLVQCPLSREEYLQSMMRP